MSPGHPEPPSWGNVEKQVDSFRVSWLDTYMTLWHTEIRLPDQYVAPEGKVALTYSAHAIAECTKDRNGTIRQFKCLTFKRFRTVEVETDGGSGPVTKILVRGQYDERNDIVMALVPQVDGTYFVKTVWLNRTTDTHKTLDRSKYAA